MIGKLITDGFSDLLNTLIDEGIKLFLTFLVGIYEVAGTVLALTVVQNGILLAQTIALAILVPKIGFEAITMYILRLNGDSSSGDPGVLLKGLATSVAVIMSVPWIVTYVFGLGTSLASDVGKLDGYDPKGAGTFLEEVIKALQANVTMPFFLAIAIIVMIVMIVIVILQTFIRAGELVMAAVVGCFMALGLTNPGSSSFSSWFKEIVAICFTQAAQLFILRVAFSSLHAVTYDNPWYSIMLFLGLIWVAIKTPSTVKTFAHTTGTGRALGSGVQQGVSTALMKRAMTKGAA